MTPLQHVHIFSLLSIVLPTPNIKIALLYTNETLQSQVAFSQAILELNENKQMLPETLLEEVAINIGSNNDNPATSTYKMCRLLAEDDVVAIVGPFTSGQVKSCSYIAGQIGLPIVSPTATATLTNPLWARTLARLSATNKRQAIALVDLLQFYKWERVSIMYTNEPYGITLAEAVKDQLFIRKLVLITEVEIEYEVARDVTPAKKKAWIEQLLNSATRITLLLVQADYGDIILEAAAKHNMINKVYGWIASTAVSEDLLTVYDEDGIIKPYYDGVVGLSSFLDVTAGFYRRLQKVYKKQGYTVLTPTDALVYDAVYLIAHSLDQVFQGGGELSNFDGQCYEENPSTDWTLGTQMFIKFATFKYTGIAGYRQMWPDGQPDQETLRYNIVNVRRKSNNVTKIGYWGPEDFKPVRIETPAVWNNETDEPPNASPRFINSTLKLGVLEDKPFVIYNYSMHGYDNCSAMPNPDWCYTGVSIEIIKMLRVQLKFNYEFVESSDGKFGNEVDGVWDGLISDIYKQDIDVGVVGFGISHSREKVVDFGISFYPGGVGMAVREDPVPSNLFFFLRPFSCGVWISIFCGIAFFFVAVFLLDKYSPYGHAGGVRFKCGLCGCADCKELLKRGEVKDHVCPFKEDHELKHQMGIMSIPNALWLSICSFLTVAPTDGIPKNWSGRIVISVWWMMCMVMASMYTANLAAFLTVSRMEVEINSIEDLLKQRVYLFGTVMGTVTENLIKYSDSANLKKVAARANSTISYEGAIKRLQEEKYIFMYGMGPLDYTTSDHCNLKLIGDSVLVNFGYAFAFQIGSPYKEVFNTEMLAMTTEGTIKDLWHKFVKGKCPEDSTFEAEADSIEVWSILGLVIICSPMIVAAIFVFGLELFASPKNKHGKRMDAGDVLRAQFEMSPRMVGSMVEESVGLTTTQTSPHVSLGYSMDD